MCQAGRNWDDGVIKTYMSVSQDSLCPSHLYSLVSVCERTTVYQAPFTLGCMCVSSPVKPTLCPKWWSCCWCTWSWKASTRRAFTASQGRPVERGSSTRFWRRVRNSAKTWNAQIKLTWQVGVAHNVIYLVALTGIIGVEQVMAAVNAKKKF